MMSISTWLIFGIVISALLAFDLGYVNRKSHQAGLREAILLSCFYIAISLLFAAWLYISMGADYSFLFLTGYIVEKSLSVDNLFVFLLIFSYFNVGIRYQHRILFWGILGALVTRGIFIFAGISIINLFHPIIYLFGALLIYTGYKLLTAKDDDEAMNPEDNFFLKAYHKYFSYYIPLKKDYEGSKFFIKEKGVYFITPLFLVLLVIESSDVMFATDSVPAILSISQDPFIVYTSNIFAILGLRALYFVLAKIMPMFTYLNYGVAVVLTFIGVKMVINDFVEIPTAISLLVVAGCLLLSVVASVIWKKEEIIVETEKVVGE